MGKRTEIGILGRDKNPMVKQCDQCGKTVTTVLKEVSMTVPIFKENVEIKFMAHHCPECGVILCERDFDTVMMEMVDEAYKRKTGHSLSEVAEC